MQVSVEKVSNIERRLTIIVPANQVEDAYALEVNQLMKKANLKGFRPGKAPRSYIEQQYGHDARQQALSKVIQESLYKALAEQQLHPVSTPQVLPKSMLAGQPLEFIASFEVMPEIEKVQFSMDKIEKLLVDVQSADVSYVIDQLQKQFTTWNRVERAVQETDQIVIDYYPIFEGQAEMDQQVQGVTLKLGTQQMIPGFEEGLIGATAGEERTLHLTYPADYSDVERQGKPVTFVVKILQVFAADTPAIDEALVKKLGVASGKVEDLEAQVQRTINMERDRLVKEKLKEQVFRVLLEQNTIEVPVALIQREAKQIHDEIHPSHASHQHEHTEQEMAMFNEIAKKRLALGMLIAEYAKQHEIKVNQEHVKARIQEIASAYEHPQEVETWLSTKERRAGIEAQVMEDQVLHHLIEGIPVNETTMSYAELKGIAQS